MRASPRTSILRRMVALASSLALVGGTFALGPSVASASEVSAESASSEAAESAAGMEGLATSLQGCDSTPTYVRLEPGDSHGIDFSSTRTKGHNQFTVGGLKVWTVDADSQSKAAGYIPIDIPLAEAGTPAFDWQHISGLPTSLQLVLDKEGDGSPDGYLAYEPASYGEIYWSHTDFGVGGVEGAYPSFAPLSTYLSVHPNAKVLAIGYSLGSGAEGSGVLRSLSIGCTVYYFAFTPIQACASTATVPVTESNHTLFDWSQTRATGHWQYVTGGLRTWTEGATSTDKVAAYTPVDFSLGEVGLADFSYTFAPGKTPMSLQLSLDKDGNGTHDAYLVYEPAYYAGWWSSTGGLGVPSGMGYNSYGTLNEYWQFNPNAKVKAVGFSLGSGVHSDGVLHSLTAGCTTYSFAHTPIASCASTSTVRVNPADLRGFDFAETRATGHYSFGPTGLRTWTESNTSTDKVAGYTAVNIPLADIGVPDISMSLTSGTTGPSLQLGLDSDGDGDWDGYLVYEPMHYGVGNYWSSKNFGVGAGGGYPSMGTLDAYLGANPAGKIISIGFSLGSGVHADAVLHSLTAGCTTYEFGTYSSSVALSGLGTVNVGTPVTATVTVTGPPSGVDLSGPVVLTRNGTPVVNGGISSTGSALLALGTLPAGDYDLVAEYAGNAAVDPANSAEGTLRVLFADYGTSQPFVDAVQWLVSTGITTGNTSSGNTFGPNSEITRQALATWLYRYQNPGVPAPACEEKPFTDVAMNHVFCGEIAWLKSAGLTTGYTDGSFRGGEQISREALAAWFSRMELGLVQPNLCATKPFTDVTTANVFCGHINWLKVNNITTGYNDGTFKPKEEITRQAVAAWLHRFDVAFG